MANVMRTREQSVRLALSDFLDWEAINENTGDWPDQAAIDRDYDRLSQSVLSCLAADGYMVVKDPDDERWG